MKKMNNKGFAISALVYGLAIMGILIVAMLMKTVSSTRENQKLLSEMIEDELNNLGMSSSAFVPVAGDEGQVFTAQEAGLYRIELWGAAGANGSGGKGSYTSGVIYLKEAQSLFFFIGKSTESTAEGGHETDVRLISNGGYTDPVSYETRIMVAGGGGTTGPGRGIVRVDSPQLVAPTGSNGGGDGYIPGISSAQGGSSFISGYGSSQAIIKGAGYKNDPTYKYSEVTGVVGSTYQYASGPGKKYYFVDGIVIPGVNAGNGKATIKKISSGSNTSDIKKEIDFKPKKIKICNDTFTSSDINTVNISAVDSSGENYIQNNLSFSSNCIEERNLSGLKEVDEITISGLDPNKQYTIKITPSSGQVTTFSNVKPNKSGEFRYSTYQAHDASQNPIPNKPTLPNKSNYYIESVADESKFLTYNSANNKILPMELTGNKNQIWEITKVKVKKRVGNTNVIEEEAGYKYKIVEMTKYNAMEATTENTVNDITEIVCNGAFNSISKTTDTTQVFDIIYNKDDDTYSIIPYSGDNSQALAATDNGLIAQGLPKSDSQKFRLITIDYNK